MSIRVIRNLIVIKAEEKKQKSIIVTPMKNELNIWGRIVKIGSGHLSITGEISALEVKVGDLVLFSKGASIEVREDGELFYIVQENSIICIDEEDVLVKPTTGHGLYLPGNN